MVLEYKKKRKNFNDNGLPAAENFTQLATWLVLVEMFFQTDWINFLIFINKLLYYNFFILITWSLFINDLFFIRFAPRKLKWEMMSVNSHAQVCYFICITGLPHTQGTQGIRETQWIFKLKKISENFNLFFKLREVLIFL